MSYNSIMFYGEIRKKFSAVVLCNDILDLKDL